MPTKVEKRSSTSVRNYLFIKLTFVILENDTKYTLKRCPKTYERTCICPQQVFIRCAVENDLSPVKLVAGLTLGSLQVVATSLIVGLVLSLAIVRRIFNTTFFTGSIN